MDSHGRPVGAPHTDRVPRPASGLPLRPALAPHAPVLRRGADVLQVGLDPRTAVVLSGPGVADLLGRLDGRQDLSSLRSHSLREGMTRSDVDAVLHALHRAGLLTAAPSAPPVGTRLPSARAVSQLPPGGRGDRPAVRLVGLGALGHQVAGLLLGAGVHVYAAGLGGDRSRPRTPLPLADLASGPHPYGAELRLVNHWSKPQHELVRLTVVAADTVEPDRVVPETLMRDDQPHLVLRSSGTAVTVGPLVLPGRTACVRCTDLTRRDLDPAWPLLLSQLTVLRLSTPAVLLAWGAAVAAAQVLAVLQHSVPEVAGATLELDLTDHLTRWRAWPRHVSCGCSWAGTTDWGS